MKIIVPDKVLTVINNLGNKTKRKSGLKIYTALYLRNNRKNKHGYFSCPANYLKKINSRYETIMAVFLKGGIIKYLENLKQDPTDIFNTIRTKDYSPNNGIAMKYKFLVDITSGIEMESDFENKRKYRWHDVLSNSLIELGYEPRIKRDNFGERVYHPLIKDYKTVLKNKGCWVIDAKASHPTLLWIMMKERKIRDENYFRIFETETYFYNYLIEELNLNDKEQAKHLFSEWLNSKGYVSNPGIYRLFPTATKFIKGLKQVDYKDSSSLFHYKEAKIWINDLLENIPTDFAIPVHDSLIIKAEDVNLVLGYCQEKYPDLKFKEKEL
jgi:hypothetical protein